VIAMRPKLIAGAVVCAALAVGLTACGGSDSSSSSYKEPKGPPVKVLNVESGNVFFKPTELSTPPGIVEIHLKNIESGAHDLEIHGIPGFQVEVSGEGSTASGKVQLKKGKYTFYCSIPGHEEAGMKGTITVS
jgi:plastocyanin